MVELVEVFLSPFNEKSYLTSIPRWEKISKIETADIGQFSNKKRLFLPWSSPLKELGASENKQEFITFVDAGYIWNNERMADKTRKSGNIRKK